MACSPQGVPWEQSVRAGEAAGAQHPGTGRLSRFQSGPGASSGGGRAGGLVGRGPALLHAAGAGPALTGASCSGSKGLWRRSGARPDRDQP